MEKFSSRSMMENNETKDWDFNIFQLCAPSKFGSFQGLVDQALVTEDSLVSQSVASFTRIAQFATDLSFYSFFDEIQISLKTLCEQSDIWAKTENALPLCGYSPSELITKVGDCLLTLPQYLDPLSNENIKLALINTNLKYLDQAHTGWYRVYSVKCGASILPQAEFGPNNHQEYAPHFILEIILQ